MKNEELKFRQMVDRKLTDFCVKYDDYFGIKFEEGFHTTTDVLLYLDNKPPQNRTETEQKAVEDLQHFRDLQAEYQQLIDLNRERAIQFNTTMSISL